MIYQDHQRAIIAFKHWDDVGGQIVVVANLKDEYAGSFTIGKADLNDGTWHEYVFDYDIDVEGGVLNDTLGPSEVKGFIKQ